MSSLSTSSIWTYLAGIKFFLKLLTGSSCSSSHLHVSLLLKGFQRTEVPPSTPVHNTRHPVCLHPDAAVWLHLHHSLFHTIINVSFGIFGDSCNVQSLHPHLLSTTLLDILVCQTFPSSISLAGPHQSTISGYHLPSASVNHLPTSCSSDNLNMPLHPAHYSTLILLPSPLVSDSIPI